MQCPHCSASIRPDSRFCSHCGCAVVCPSCESAIEPRARFCSRCGKAVGAASVPSAPQPAIASPPSDYSAERRQISVMFCDLVDSTAMSARLDPEDHHEIIRAYQHTCAEIIAEFGGYVAQYLGDGIMVYFGFPRAHEDDPERAVLAALRITTAVANLRIRSDLRMSTRVGIATGLVVVGDRIAAGTGWEVGVVGETPNLAARLQGLAQPNTIVIGASTRRLLGHQFEYQDLGEHPLKGFDHPIHAWRVIEERAVDSRFKAVRSALMVPLVDRADERALLRDRGIRALNGQGQIVLLGGEPGIGKSRLARAAVEILCDESGAWLLEIQCSSFHTQSALFPVITALRHAIFPDGVPKEAGAGWTRLQEFFTEIGFTQEDALPLFANLLAIAAPSGQPPLAPAPERHKQLTLQYALELIERAAGNSPVLVLLEDLHWSDPTTLELVNLFVDRSRSRRMFGLFTTRPGFSAAWTNRPNVTALTLGRLANVDAIELVRHMSGLEPLAPEVVETVITKTDGIPLYLQEYTKTMVEFRQSDRTGGGRAAAVIPDTLHDLLLARLDRLGDAKLIAKLAAMLGREFSVTVLEAVWSGDRETLWDGINKLIEEDVIHFRDELLRERMLFRHALVQDAAYQSQLKSSRAQMHRRIAEVIEQQFPDSVSSEPESLASHFTAANLPVKAIPYWEQAGNRAIGLAAYSEASRHFQAALDLVARLPEEPGRHGIELGLQLQFGLSLSGSIGYSAPGVETAYQRARELCGLLGDTADLYPVLRGLINFYIVRGDLKTSLELSESCLRLADETGHPEYRVEACNAMGYTLGYMGSLRQGAAMLEEGIRTYRTSLGEKRSVPSPHDPLIGCSSFLLLALWLMGEGDRAVQCQQDLLEVLKQRDQPFDEAYAS